MKRDPDMKYITRKEWGYWVRFHKGSHKAGTLTIKMQKHFPFSQYGGVRKALAAAKDFRDKHAPSVQRDSYQRKAIALKATHSRSSTSVVGIGRQTKILPSGSTSRCFAVTWAQTERDGTRKVKRKSFSYSSGGRSKAEAWELAVKLRKQVLKSHYKGER